MNRSHRLAGLVLAAVTAIPGLAMAGGPASAERARCRELRHAKHMQHDVDKDGALEPAERRAMRQGRRQDALARYDADRDGTMNDAERARMKADRIDARFAKLDVNRDGRISRVEAEVPCSRLSRRFDVIDADNNDRITKVELAAARDHMRNGKGKRGKDSWRKRHSSGG